MEALDTMESIFGPVISCYTRNDAIKDGQLIPVSNVLLGEAGILFPTAITQSLYAYIKKGDEQGRLWDLLFVFKCNAKVTRGSRGEFTVKFGNRNVTVVSRIGATSPTDPTPVITLMLPSDD